ncbi:hypothetical protein AYI70_g10092, partial [Smittium culicis]
MINDEKFLKRHIARVETQISEFNFPKLSNEISNAEKERVSELQNKLNFTQKDSVTATETPESIEISEPETSTKPQEINVEAPSKVASVTAADPIQVGNSSVEKNFKSEEISNSAQRPRKRNVKKTDREELLGSRSVDETQTKKVDASNVQSILDLQKATQQDLADDLLNMAKALKSNTLLFGETLKKDNELVQ